MNRAPDGLRAAERAAPWLARAGLLLTAVSIAMVVAGIWADWRWLGTGCVTVIVAAGLLALAYMCIGEDDDA